MGFLVVDRTALNRTKLELKLLRISNRFLLVFSLNRTKLELK